MFRSEIVNMSNGKSPNVVDDNIKNTNLDSNGNHQWQNGSNKTHVSKQRRNRPTNVRFPSSLDFERVINQYSIQAMLDRLVQTTVIDETDENDVFDDDRSNGINGETNHLLDKGQVTNGKPYKTFDGSVSPRKTSPPQPPPLHPHSAQPGMMFHFTVKHKHTATTVMRWVLTILTGLITGLLSILILTCTDTIHKWGSNLLDTYWQKQQLETVNPFRDTNSIFYVSSPKTLFILYSIINLSCAMIAATLCLCIAPEAIGSGIPEVKAYLNGVRVKRFASIRILFVKIVGTIASVSSGLAVGPEGPLVQIGAIIGAGCSKISNFILRIFPDNTLFLFNEDLWSFVTTELSHFSTDSERRDLVSIGAAAGFAAAFGAPIGGLLFSMEDASSYFDHSLFLKTLSATAVATLCLAVHHGNLSEYSVISLGNYETPNENIFLNRVAELPLYVLVAVVGGILGGIFCKVFGILQTYRNRKFVSGRKKIIWKLTEVALLSIVTSSLTYLLPLLPCFCRIVSRDDDLVTDDATNAYRFHSHQFDCPPGHINELAVIFFGSRIDAISAILTSPEQFNIWTLVTVSAVFYPLMLLTLGVSLPSGIFMPSFLIGTSMGGVLGLLFQRFVNTNIPSSTFALLGAAALLAGIQRSTVSLCVILVEGTGQVKILIPVIITVVVARYVAELVDSRGLYEACIEINRYPFLEHNEIKSYDIFQVCLYYCDY
jgi:H+/Cl- antiporter ClcA